MRRLNSQGCSIWQACPAPGRIFISQIRNPRLQGERALMGGVLAAAEDDGRAGDPCLVILGIRLRVRLELMDDRLQIGPNGLRSVNMSAKKRAIGVARKAGLKSSNV